MTARIATVVFSIVFLSRSLTAQSFTAAQAYPYNSSIAIADFNGDHIPDYATGNGPRIQVYLGNGDGTFRLGPATTIQVRAISGIAAGDFNGDGIADLAFTALNASLGLEVALGKGDGSFGTPTTVLVNGDQLASAPLLADLNHDGHLDIAVVDGATALTYLGDGAGGFTGPVVAKLGVTHNQLSIIRLADATGDKKPDLLIPVSTGIDIFPGVGNGAFSTVPIQIPSAQPPTDSATGDFDHNGFPDVVVKYPGAVAVSLGFGHGTFGSPQVYSGAFAASPVGVVDTNFDGNLDIVTGDVAVLRGFGDGTFDVPSSYPACGSDLAFGQLHKAGVFDILVGGCNQTTVLINKGAGHFLYAYQSPVFTAGAQPSAFDTFTRGDFNADGHPDLAFATQGTIQVVFGTGTRPSPLVGGPVTVTGFSKISSMTAADVNHDGRLDLIYAAQDASIHVLLGNGDGTFTASVWSAVPPKAAFQMLTGDFNGDGFLDLITDSGYLYLGIGDGTFGAPVHVFTPASNAGSDLVVADFNNDGKLDIAWASNPSVKLGNGDGTFGPAIQVKSGSFCVATIAVGDFNHDGIADLAFGAPGSYQCPAPHLGVVLGKGDGTFQAPIHFNEPFWNVGFTVTPIVFDFNGDGIDDLAVEVPSSQVISFFPSNGDGTFQTGLDYVTPFDPIAAVVRMQAGTGPKDIVLAYPSGNGVQFSILFNNAP